MSLLRVLEEHQSIIDAVKNLQNIENDIFIIEYDHRIKIDLINIRTFKEIARYLPQTHFKVRINTLNEFNVALYYDILRKVRTKIVIDGAKSPIKTNLIHRIIQNVNFQNTVLVQVQVNFFL